MPSPPTYCLSDVDSCQRFNPHPFTLTFAVAAGPEDYRVASLGSTLRELWARMGEVQERVHTQSPTYRALGGMGWTPACGPLPGVPARCILASYEQRSAWRNFVVQRLMLPTLGLGRAQGLCFDEGDMAKHIATVDSSCAGDGGRCHPRLLCRLHLPVDSATGPCVRSPFYRLAIRTGLPVVPVWLDARSGRFGHGQPCKLTGNAAQDMPVLREAFGRLPM